MEQFNPLDLSDRVVLVTGASSGIGRASAIYLSKLGARIIATARNKERLHETLEMLSGKGHEAIPFDLSDVENIESLVCEAVKRCGKLNGLVNCAGIPYVMPLNVLLASHMEEILRVDLLPFIELARLFGKKKYSSGGSVVTISSLLALRPRENETGYITAKGAMNAAVGSLACDLAHREIRVNGIVCGSIMTEMLKQTITKYDNEDYVNAIVEKALLGMGKPEYIASVVAFLISDMSRYITGRNLYADGGMLS